MDPSVNGSTPGCGSGSEEFESPVSNKLKIEEMDNAWIEPDGTVHQVGYMCHNEWASDYFRKLIKDEDEYDKHLFSHKSSSEQLHEKGWIRLLTWTEGNTNALGNCTTTMYVMRDTMDPETTIEQRRFLRTWCKKNSYKYYDLFKD